MDGLKQRIVGALVLISLAVIFVPMLFDEPHTERTSRSIDLPEEPAFPAVEVTAPAESSPAADAAPAYTLQEEDGPSDDVEAAQDQATSAPGSASADTEGAVQQEAAVADQPKAAPEPETASASPESPEPADKAEYSQALKGAWLVQLGSFGNEKNALRLRDQVREKGYAAYTQSVARGDLTLTRVFSGPFVSEDEARSAKSRLDKSFKLNSLVMSGDK